MTIPQLTPLQLQQWQEEGRAFHLLDVRTDEETAVCVLPDAIHIPMNLIPLRQNELPDDDLPPRHPQPAYGDVSGGRGF